MISDDYYSIQPGKYTIITSIELLNVKRIKYVDQCRGGAILYSTIQLLLAQQWWSSKSGEYNVIIVFPYFLH